MPSPSASDDEEDEEEEKSDDSDSNTMDVAHDQITQLKAEVERLRGEMERR